MDLLLYHRQDCPFCIKLRMGMAALGVEAETVETELGEKHPDVVRLSPKGTVPVLVDRSSDLVIWESAVALEYVNDCTGGALFGASPEEGARIRMAAHYSDGVVGGALRDIIFEKRARPAAEWDRARIAGGEARWAEMLDRLEGWCGTFGFGGDRLTAADCALGARFGLAAAYGAGVTLAHPKVHAWFEGLKRTDAYRFAMPENLPMEGRV